MPGNGRPWGSDVSEDLNPDPRAFSPILRLTTQVGEKSPVRGSHVPTVTRGRPSHRQRTRCAPRGPSARARGARPTSLCAGSWCPGCLSALAAWLPCVMSVVTRAPVAADLYGRGLDGDHQARHADQDVLFWHDDWSGSLCSPECMGRGDAHFVVTVSRGLGVGVGQALRWRGNGAACPDSGSGSARYWRPGCPAWC